MLKQVKKVTTTSTWAASSDLTPVDLPREGLITEVKIRFAITASGAMTTNQPDALYRCIQNLKLQGDGGRSFLGMSGEQMGRLLGYLNLMEFGSPLTDLPAATTQFQEWVFHPGSNPHDPFDISAVIPARALSTFQAAITTTANSVIDDSQTISSGTYYYEVNQVLEVPVPKGIMVPLGSTLTYPHTANYSDFSYEIDVPTGAFLRRILVLVQDETATRPVRKNDEVGGVRLRLAKTGETILESDIEELITSSACIARGAVPQYQVADAATGHSCMPTGFFIIDLRKFANSAKGKQFGLDLTGYQNGDIKMGLTIENYASGDDTIVYWDQLQPVEPQYVNK